jgi:hypothetical protein
VAKAFGERSLIHNSRVEERIISCSYCSSERENRSRVFDRVVPAGGRRGVIPGGRARWGEVG